MNSAYILKITTQSNYLKALDKIFDYFSNSEGSVWEFCIEEGNLLFENAIPYFFNSTIIFRLFWYFAVYDILS